MPARVQEAAVGKVPRSAIKRRTASSAWSEARLPFKPNRRRRPPNSKVFELCMAGSTTTTSSICRANHGSNLAYGIRDNALPRLTSDLAVTRLRGTSDPISSLLGRRCGCCSSR